MKLTKSFIIDDVDELIGNTPLIRIRSGKDAAGSAEILGKMEFLNPGGSVKDRPCLAMIEEGERRGLITSATTIIEPTTGNTGIGLAMICAGRGYRCVLTMPDDLSLERIYLLRNYGAEVVLTPSRLGVQGSIDKAWELSRKIKNSFVPLQFDSPANPEAHRRSTAKEILEACEGRVDAFVCGVGTGGTITGTGRVLKDHNPDIRVIAVEPSGSPVLSGGAPGRHRIQGIGAGFVPKILDRELIDEIICVDEYAAFSTARKLGRDQGLCVGISSGANVWASRQVAKTMNPETRVVTLLCDTGERYFSTEQYFEA